MTDKSHSLTVPLLERLGIAELPVTVVSGDAVVRHPRELKGALARLCEGTPP